MEEALIVIISGPSGVGKDTIINRIVAERGYWVSKSVTTRAAGNDDPEKKNYYYLSVAEAKAMVENDEFIEYAHKLENYYGTPRKPFMEHLLNDECFILNIETQGCANIKKLYPEAVTIYLLPPSMDVLAARIEQRARGNGESPEGRLKSAIAEIETGKKNYEYAIVNNEIEETSEAIKKIIDEEIKKRK